MCASSYFKIYGGEKMTVNIKQLKLNYINKYPNSILAHVLSMEQDEIAAEDFHAKVSTWLTILNAEKRG
jgi:hypothetical protein